MQSSKGIVRTVQLATSVFKDLFRQRSKDKVPTRRIVHNSFGRYEVIEPWAVSEERQVPEYIPKPQYATLPAQGLQRPEIKDDYQIECMRDSCALAKTILGQVKQYIKPGISTDFLDEKIHDLIISNGAYPSPLNYHGFPKSICTSINNVACHGIPDNRPLLDGDILNVDITVYLNGYHGDCSAMFEVADVDPEAQRLIKITELCLKKAIQICKPNENFCNIGNVIEEIANQHHYNVVPGLTGHGIGQYFHGPPEILHYANNGIGKMQPGMTFTIEPVLTQGEKEVEILEDGWTIVTLDDARTAQIEHTVLITDSGCEILTL